MSSQNTHSHRFKGILIAEDEPGLCMVMESVLSADGYRVAVANDGNTALSIAVSDPDLQLILTDVRLPGKTGMQLLQEIMKVAPDRTVIVMSAYGSIEMAVEALQTGAYHFLPKPFSKDVLLHVVHKAEERFGLIEENRNLRSQIEQKSLLNDVVGVSLAIQEVLQKVQRVAPFRSTVLITGESGTGKEVVARLIHSMNASPGPFIAVNCGAIPENLLESELFGVVRGAYTGATENRTGLIAQANGGTLFLDEIAELPLQLQVKLLRVIQEGMFRPLGSTQEIRVQLRWMAATSRNLRAAVAKGTFREDLYYRLNVVPIQLPPLRERTGDIQLLARHFLAKFARRYGVKEKTLSFSALQRLEAYTWPGNVRELENWMERVTILSDRMEITEEDLPLGIPESKIHEHQDVLFYFPVRTLSIKSNIEEIEKILIQKSLEKTKGKKFAAAELLEISERALQYKMKQYKINEKETDVSS